MHHKYKTCAVVICYNGTHLIQKTIESIYNQVDYVLIVDNGSGSHTIAILRQILSKYKKLKVIYNGDNYGIANALNVGVKFAIKNKYDWVVTLDQDSIAEADMIGKLFQHYEMFKTNKKDVFSLSPNFIDVRLGDNEKRVTHEGAVYKDVVITSGHLIKTTVFNKIGYYNEDLFIDSVDFDFCLRLKEYGYKTIKCLDATLFHELGNVKTIHFGGMKLKMSTHSELRKYYIVRNHRYIIKKYLYRFPVFCIKKEAFMVVFIFKSLLFEEPRMKNIKYMIKGLNDYINSKYGKYE